ncbi:nitrogen regulation protein NR(II) [Pseudoxanthomonas koreensis]|uniref:two-component system sensor histidine kinase NtrB n=1 Tax=Pseudoxanthomonas koreensis TaxID=266061 RepID=UPI0035A5F8B1
MTPATPAPILDQLATPVAWVDPQARIAGANPAFPRWLGVGARRVLGQPLAALEQDGDALARFLAQDEREVLRLHRIALGLPGEMPRHADGWLTRTAEGWRLEVHPSDGFSALDPAQALPGALSAALKGLAHELRNPLAGLKGAAQLLARRTGHRPEDSSERELVDLIGAEIDRLDHLVDRLLSPAPQRPHAALNIHAVLERVLRLAEAEGGGQVRMQRDYDPSIPEFHGDADRLVQAVWNLVRNAQQAGAACIVLRTRVESGLHIREHLHARALRVEIADDGRGVPEALAEHLFLPLVSGRAEGTGLGLALAHQVAREHRGSLTFRSRPGHTVFTLLLPQADPEGGASP